MAPRSESAKPLANAHSQFLTISRVVKCSFCCLATGTRAAAMAALNHTVTVWLSHNFRPNVGMSSLQS